MRGRAFVAAEALSDQQRAARSASSGAARDRAAATCWWALLTTSVFYFFLNPEADNDLWGHLRFGMDFLSAGAIPRVDPYSYTAAGQPWIDHEWLSQVAMAALYGWAGSAGLLAAKFALGALTFAFLMVEICRRTSSHHVRGGLGLLLIAVLARGLAIRPQVFTYTLLALTLLVLGLYRRGRPGALWALPFIFLLWANLHGGFILGLGLLGLFAAADLLCNERRSFRPWLVLVLCTLAAALTPYRLRLLPYIANELHRPHPITEWQPVAFEPAQFAFFVLFLVFGISLGFTRTWRRDGWRVALAVAAGVAALRSQRHTPLFALCVAAPLASQLQAALQSVAPRLAPFSPSGRRLLGAAVLALALLQLGLVGARYSRSGLRIVYEPSEYPVAAVAALRAAGFHGNLAVPLDWGEYVLWFLAPAAKVSLDGRFATVFPETVVADNFSFFAGSPGWQNLLNAYRTQAVLAPADRPCPVRLLNDWQLVYRDRVAEVYVRSGELEIVGLDHLSNPAQPPRRAGVFP